MARSNQGNTMMVHTYTSQSMFLPSINLLHFTVSEIQPGQNFFPLPSQTPWVKTISLGVGRVQIIRVDYSQIKTRLDIEPS